jgi:hypothetical protein
VHQPRSRVGREGVVTEKRILEGAANHIVQIDDPNDVPCMAVDDQKAPIGVRRSTLQIPGELLGGARW